MTVKHETQDVEVDDTIAVRSQYEPVQMSVKNGIEVGFKLALGFWLFSAIVLMVVGAIMIWAGVPMPWLPHPA
jgi:hypothetical protein